MMPRVYHGMPPPDLAFNPVVAAPGQREMRNHKPRNAALCQSYKSRDNQFEPAFPAQSPPLYLLRGPPPTPLE